MMSILTLIPLCILGFLGNILLKGVALKKTVLIWLWALALLLLGMFTGFLFGEIGTLYREETMNVAITYVHEAFQEGRSAEVAEAFANADQKQHKGKSSNSALGGVISDLR